MKLLAIIRPEDVDPDAPEFDYASFVPRIAGRAIIFDGSKVALIHINEHDYYMLPGGGVDSSEDIGNALKREILEEIGCDIEVDDKVGSAEVYFDRWKQKQTDCCYVAKKVGTDAASAFTNFEQSEGFEVIWAKNLAEAIQLVKSAAPKNRDGKLVRARDLLFLESVRPV
jgi:8-oxo-dGTP diphosphatase